MRLIISFVIASLFCFVLIVPAEAQQPTKSQTPAKEKEEQSSKESVVAEPAHPCFSNERIKEDEEIRKQAAEILKQIETNPDYRPPPMETVDNFQDFRLFMRIAGVACKIKRLVEIRLESRDENLKKEQLEKVSDAATRIVAEFNARGGRASFADTDLGLLQGYGTAVTAKEAIEKAASPTLTKEMRKEQIQHAIETSKAVLRKFNETGEVAADSERVIDVFLLVVLATETIQKAGSPKLTKNLKQEEIQEAIKTSNRILAEFKTNEWNSKFAEDDKKTLENFQEALKGETKAAKSSTNPSSTNPNSTNPGTTNSRSSNMPRTRTNQAGIEFVLIPPGSFMMGSNWHQRDEKPEHQVTINYSFYMGKYEVTQAQWQAVMGNNPSSFKDCGGNCPVESVSWDDAQKFIQGLNGMNDGYTYRLPTEAEWEYACRAGTTGDYAGDLKEMAWYSENSGNKTHAVGGKRPNDWSLADMHGNVWEWCQDWYNLTYDYGAPTDGSAWLSGGVQKWRVLRGGSWFDLDSFLRSAHRNGPYAPFPHGSSIGFRVVAIARTN